MLILFDAAGTLMELAEPVEEVYSAHFSEIGIRAEPGSLAAAFREGFRVVPEPEFPPGADGEAIERGWWRRVVEHVARAAGWPGDSGDLEECFSRLFAHYASGAAWRAFPETVEILSRLRDDGHRLAVVSNFDRRLHRVLAELGLARHFDAVLTSADVGARKPSPLLIAEAMRRLRREGDVACLVGDSPREDGGAARAAGIAFFLLDRPARTLRQLPEWLGDQGDLGGFGR
jgi:putative hydrolase of the HAD superfamily